MQQDLCRPERTHRGLSLAFISRRETEGKGEEKDKSGRGETETEEGGGAESMPSIKQAGPCSLKLVRAGPRGVYRKSILMGCRGETKYPAIHLRRNGGEIHLSEIADRTGLVLPLTASPIPIRL